MRSFTWLHPVAVTPLISRPVLSVTGSYTDFRPPIFGHRFSVIDFRPPRFRTRVCALHIAPPSNSPLGALFVRRQTIRSRRHPLNARAIRHVSAPGARPVRELTSLQRPHRVRGRIVDIGVRAVPDHLICQHRARNKASRPGKPAPPTDVSRFRQRSSWQQAGDRTVPKPIWTHRITCRVAPQVTLAVVLTLAGCRVLTVRQIPGGCTAGRTPTGCVGHRWGPHVFGIKCRYSAHPMCAGLKHARRKPGSDQDA